MSEIKYLFFINSFEGKLRTRLISERKKIYKLQRQLSAELYLRASINRYTYLDNMRRLKLSKIMLSQMIKTLEESDI